jgi:predicted branched-subunit amino acid permease
VQRDVPERVRTSVFAWSETMLQMLWVVGGTLGIVLPLEPHIGFSVCAVALVWTIVMAALQRRRAEPGADRTRARSRLRPPRRA